MDSVRRRSAGASAENPGALGGVLGKLRYDRRCLGRRAASEDKVVARPLLEVLLVYAVDWFIQLVYFGSQILIQ